MKTAAAAVQPPRLLTLEQWGALDEDEEGELVNGVLEEEEVANYLHEIIVGWLITLLTRWAQRRSGGVTGSEAKLAIAPKRGRKPDVSVFLGRVPAPFDTLIRVVPHLVVEVVSPRPRDARRDRVDKLHDYANAGVKYYWLLDPQLRALEILELSKKKRYVHALDASEGRLDPIPGCPGLIVDLDALWSYIDRQIELSAAAPPKPRPAKRSSRKA